MRTMWTFVLALSIFLPAAAREPLAQRIGHSDPTKYTPLKAVHGGPGELDGMFILDGHALDTNLQFLHRAILQPKSGAGEHFHNTAEELFVIFDGEAQFTIDGRTSVLKGPAGALCRAGHSHAIYNATDKPIQWLNINVSQVKGSGDAFNLNDPRVDVQLDAIPQFMTMRLDRQLLRNAEGKIQQRRVFDSSVFLTPWSYVDHFLLPPGTATAPRPHRELAQVYYVMNGSGKVTVSSTGTAAETASIKPGDAIPINLGDTSSFENTENQPLEFLVIGISRDLAHKLDAADMLPFSR
jgi:mannose-6-phosphate isomerase-like protein (cupin superfamily)